MIPQIKAVLVADQKGFQGFSIIIVLELSLPIALMDHHVALLVRLTAPVNKLRTLLRSKTLLLLNLIMVQTPLKTSTPML